MSPETIVGLIEESRLRGRGGAGFSTGKKWAAVSRQFSEEKYVVANADEGDPGAFSDRLLMIECPELLVESMAIAAKAVRANRGFIYLRAEYGALRQHLEMAIVSTLRALQVDNFTIGVVMGEGSYVCGEETALMNSIEKKRPEVRLRPPFPTTRGLWNLPTLVNNVETLCAVPWIVGHGSEKYRSMGFSESRGTKLLSLNSLFHQPGVVEVDFGITLRKICEDLGGGLRNRKLKGMIVGGPLAGALPARMLDTQLGFEQMKEAGACVGHGGVVAFGDDTSMRDLVLHVLEFALFESCGKCTPCRLIPGGLIEHLRSPGTFRLERSEWEKIVSVLRDCSLCGHGTGTADFLNSIRRYFSEELWMPA
jgi:formate dehydrogenase iron-sulfur subunit